ncbi:hypothetical protein GJ744_006737 [Endocarpon pusillum]|uniref:Uncharacterized protein n=1 Tax=Endocarpon pusillum TaxID=364733 RepID=A0A8H7AJV7_9EURO|nr:hypothetical protein GJ744_006737 [Endocarpon pusillum]
MVVNESGSESVSVSVSVSISIGVGIRRRGGEMVVNESGSEATGYISKTMSANEQDMWQSSPGSTRSQICHFTGFINDPIVV